MPALPRTAPALSIAIIAALILVVAALYIRRTAWRSPQEQAITANIALQGISAFLILPWSSQHIGQPLYTLTGVGNLEDLAGTTLYIAAGSTVLINGMDMRYEGEQLQHLHKQRIEIPTTIVVSVLVYLHLFGCGSSQQVDDFLSMKSCGYLTIYWCILCGTLIYFLAHSTQLFFGVKDEPGFKWLMTGYITAASFGIIACWLKITVAILPVDDSAATPHIRVLTALCTAGFAISSSWEWWRYERAMSRRSGELAI